MCYNYELYHHGIKGQQWGKRNSPPYPSGASSSNRLHRPPKSDMISKNARFVSANMLMDEYLRAKELWRKYDEINIPQSEKEKEFAE